MDAAIVLGTYNRLPLLKKAVESIRRSVSKLDYRIVVVDGGSKDGTCEWLFSQHDVVPIYQRLPLTGAVVAYNLGFMYAVESGARFVGILNDDDELLGPEPEIEICAALMNSDPTIGAVAFETDLRGPWQCENIHSRPYCNKGLVRRQAGMAAARAAGDPDGYCWWSRDHLTYASDTEMGCWIWRLGWRIVEGKKLRVKDNARNVSDSMREANIKAYQQSGSVAKYHERWDDPRRLEYSREDAEKFGGRVPEERKPPVVKPASCYGVAR